MSSDDTVKVDTGALAAGAEDFADITAVLGRIADGMQGHVAAARAGFGSGDVGRILNEKVLPQAVRLHEAANGLSVDTGQVADGLKTSVKGYTATNDENNADVGRISGGDEGGGRGGGRG